ncbi:MAG: hypothetical protein JSW47_05500 [Phycisphaerales bacterium]|nr:MAG: hypothetical protein JSW47_05500 [Phycisphaerales bacterium]
MQLHLLRPSTLNTRVLAIIILNMLEVFLGNSYEDAEHRDENGFTVGLTYERRLSELLGFGGFYEYAAGDFDKWSIGVPLLFITMKDGVLRWRRDWNTEKAMTSFYSVREWPTSLSSLKSG